LLYYLGLLGKHGRDGLSGLSGEKGKTFRTVVYFYLVIQPNYFHHVVETIILLILYKQEKCTCFQNSYHVIRLIFIFD